MIILHIETSTHVCSVALSEDEKLIFSRRNDEGRNHAALLSVFIAEAFGFLDASQQSPDAVAVSGGPGSYTGLRIGISTAKGLCYGLGIPLISINTTEIMFLEAIRQRSVSPQTIYIPMIDARRMEVYAAVYDAKGQLSAETQAIIVDEHSFSGYTDVHEICLFGNGAEKCLTTLSHLPVVYLPDINPLAENMIIPARKKYLEGDFEDVAYYEPFYLKEFFTTAKKIF